jgi:hypothetical protein
MRTLMNNKSLILPSLYVLLTKNLRLYSKHMVEEELTEAQTISMNLLVGNTVDKLNLEHLFFVHYLQLL